MPVVVQTATPTFRPVLQYTKGMIVAAIANRTIEKATQAYVEAGLDAGIIQEAKSAAELEAIVTAG